MKWKDEDIFLASGYMTSHRYLISSAQSLAIRCSCTLIWCVLSSGSINAKILHVLLWVYSESNLPDALLRALELLPGVGRTFRPCRQQGLRIIGGVRKHQEHPPYTIQIPRPLFGEIPICASVRSKPIFLMIYGLLPGWQAHQIQVLPVLPALDTIYCKSMK